MDQPQRASGALPDSEDTTYTADPEVCIEGSIARIDSRPANQARGDMGVNVKLRLPSASKMPRYYFISMVIPESARTRMAA
jgi:hypothetical protein